MGISWDLSNRLSRRIHDGRGHLVTIQSKAETDFLCSVFGDINQCVLGGFQRSTVDETKKEQFSLGWQWITGEPWDYVSWASARPDDGYGNQDSLRFVGQGQWDDINRYEKTSGFLVEWDGYPLFDLSCNINSPEYFPDSAFLKFIRTFLHIDSSGAFTADSLAGITGTLDLSNLGISDITGIRYFKNINQLNLSHNHISDLSELIVLTWQKPQMDINLSYNDLSITEQECISLLDESCTGNLIYSPANSIYERAYRVVNWEGNGHYYCAIDYPIGDEVTTRWTDAGEIAAQLFNGTGYLATMTSDGEGLFLVNSFGWPNIASHWLGGYREMILGNLGNWRWVTEEPWSYARWDAYSPEPNNFSGNEYYLQFAPEGRQAASWNDGPMNGYRIRGLIVEWDTDPVATPTPTPGPANLRLSFNESTVEEAGFFSTAASGMQAAPIHLGLVPLGEGTDGQGMIISPEPGQGTLAIQTTPISVGPGPTLFTVNVMADAPGALAALAVLNAPMGVDMGFIQASGPDVPVGEWGQLLLIYDPPNDAVYVGVQVALNESAESNVNVYYDNLMIRELPELTYEPVILDASGSFDSGNTNIFPNVNQNTGSVVLLPALGGGRNVLLSIDETSDAANVGIFASQLQGGFPHILKASVDVSKWSGYGGVVALVMTNGYGNVGTFVSGDKLPALDNTPMNISIGGGFTTENSSFPIINVVQNGSTGTASAVIVDNLEVKRVTGGM